jgi:hypothetical protein
MMRLPKENIVIGVMAARTGAAARQVQAFRESKKPNMFQSLAPRRGGGRRTNGRRVTL